MDLAVDVALAALVFVALGLVITPRVRAWLDQDMTAVAGTFAITAIAGLLMLRAYGDAASRGSGKPLLLLGLTMLLISLGAAVVLIHLVRRQLVSRRAHQER